MRNIANDTDTWVVQISSYMRASLTNSIMQYNYCFGEINSNRGERNPAMRLQTKLTAFGISEFLHLKNSELDTFLVTGFIINLGPFTNPIGFGEWKPYLSSKRCREGIQRLIRTIINTFSPYESRVSTICRRGNIRILSSEESRISIHDNEDRLHEYVDTDYIRPSLNPYTIDMME